VNAPYPPQQPAQQPPSGATIAVNAKFFPMAFFFFFVKPAITIDGYPVPAVWGRNAIPVAPGRHEVHVHTPYFLPSRVGPADTTVDVAPGQTLDLEYRSPVVVFMNGALGAPPQKYPGMLFMIILYVVLALLIVCCCGAAILGGGSGGNS
jgi:hypothetical protein